MNHFKRLFGITFGLVAAAACLLFVLENQQGIEVSFLGWATPQWPVSVVVIFAFLLGMVIGPAIGWFIAARGRRRVRRAALAQRAVQSPSA
ncbi:lipopolysaccharide assembly protein LapA domain-containing protein [Pseudomonas sp. KNUC1026]|uniref:lipopolysaccharide assembly protein LapA domain-containing protein n=1 Tax=Pseudomonas sp. KNUC1026 TaxID=2893890 RepID=UPI001F479F2F|nr:LapA family protein [Pseudomonas sp. KNUC1026]UFH48252.1 LapA family protein [Pseudomonas sp. KNUC1026]